MVGMVSHTGLSFDHGRHAPGSPEQSAKAVAFRAFFERAFQLEELPGGQARLASDPPSFLEGLGTVGLPSLEPAIGRLPMDADFAGHLGLA